MKKKFLLIPVVLICALCCAFSLAACGGDDVTTKVKDEAQWKQAIADARKSDNVRFTAEFENDDTSIELIIEAAGSAQYVKMTAHDKKTPKTDTAEYYYDGNYVYFNVAEKGLGYTWQKIDAKAEPDKYAEPLSYIEMVYSGELPRNMLGLDVKFDGLDKLSDRYADAQYGFDSEKYGADTYVIIDGDLGADGIVYTLNFKPEYKNLFLVINSAGWRVSHSMAGTYDRDWIVVNIPTESVGVAEGSAEQ